ncbi:MAG: hypothetical protein WC878_00960 [Candidatus Paceibacterota bacterium]|jgi:hypothetical protein
MKSYLPHYLDDFSLGTERVWKTEKKYDFLKREKETNWTESELYNAEADIIIFLNFGKTALEKIDREIPWDERRFCY